jgi:hypothetical protein
VRDEQVADFDLDDERGAIRHAAADGRPVLEWFETRIVVDGAVWSPGCASRCTCGAGPADRLG